MWFRYARCSNAFSIFYSIRTAAPARIPELLAVVSNDSAFTFSNKCQSLIAATTAFAIASPVPLGSLGTFKRRSTPRPETRISKRSTFSWFQKYLAAIFHPSGLQVEHLESRYQNCPSTLSLRQPCVLFCYVELTNDLMLDQLEFDQQQLRMKPKHRLHCDRLFFSVKSCYNLWTDDILWARLFRFWCHGVIVRLDILVLSADSESSASTATLLFVLSKYVNK